MEQVLLWVSLVGGILLFLCRFIPLRPGGSDVADTDAQNAEQTTSPLRGFALVLPFLGLLATLPPASLGPFHNGQKLGLGFLIGGLAALAANLSFFVRRSQADKEPVSFLSLASSYGTSIAAVSLALLFLRQSLMDGLMGVALGGFCVYFVLMLARPQPASYATRLTVGAGFLAALAAGTGLAVFRDAVTPELSKMAWAAALLAFAALGGLLAAGANILFKTADGAARLAPLAVLALVGGLILYLLAQKITDGSPLFLPGVGGLLLWPVLLVLVREERRGGNDQNNGFRPALLLASLLMVSGFMAALQLMQGVGAAVGILALFLGHLATLSFDRQDTDSDTRKPSTLGGSTSSLLVLGSLLLLWRFFTTRWASDLRGVNLSDQYALFGLFVGAALPRLLSVVPERFAVNGANKSGAAGMTLAFCGLLALSCPAAVLVLFGAKSAVALLIGLALGVLPLAAPHASQFPAFFALAVSLALAQFTGHAIPVHAPTRMEKIRVLLVIMAGVVVAVFAARRIVSNPNTTTDGEEGGVQ